MLKNISLMSLSLFVVLVSVSDSYKTYPELQSRISFDKVGPVSDWVLPRHNKRFSVANFWWKCTFAANRKKLPIWMIRRQCVFNKVECFTRLMVRKWKIISTWTEIVVLTKTHYVLHSWHRIYTGWTISTGPPPISKTANQNWMKFWLHVLDKKPVKHLQTLIIRCCTTFGACQLMENICLWQLMSQLTVSP